MAIFRLPHCTMQSLWMIVASLLFACMGVCVKLGSAHFSTGELVFYRGFVGLLMMIVLLRLQGISYATPHWRLQLSRGVSGTIALMCYFFALGILPLATAVTLNYTSPCSSPSCLPGGSGSGSASPFSRRSDWVSSASFCF